MEKITDHPIHMGAPRRGGGGGQLTEIEGDVMIADPAVRPKRPPMYQVILLNDDYTPMDFVVTVLEQIFRKDSRDAMELMLQVHHKGQAIVGTYTRDVAETKVNQVIEYARINDYPLTCTLQQEP